MNEELRQFLEALGYDEEPMGMYYTDRKPEGGYAPKEMGLPTAADEAAGAADLGRVWGGWSCVLGHLWVARKKGAAAWFDRSRYGCLGGAYFLGYNKPQLEAIVHYVSTGIPGAMEGEHYLDSPEAARRYYAELDAPPAPAPYAVFQPLSRFSPDGPPLLVHYFARPEVISGLHQLTMNATGDMEAVASPWGAGCANLVTWPLVYQSRGQDRAVLGGWDPSCRKFLKTDEITFTVSWKMHQAMLSCWRESFLARPAWRTVQKKIERSKKAWGEK